MKQQINLYQAVFRPQKKTFSAADMLLLFALCLVIFAGMYVYEVDQLKALEAELSNASGDITRLMVQVDKLGSQFPAKAKSKVLETEITRLNRELAKRKEIKDALAQHSLENKRVFSALLESLARKHVQGTWLTKVSISDGGAALGIAGKTYSSALVPVYIQQLAEESSLAGLSFNVLELNRSNEDPRNLDFIFRTNPGRL